ncbi:MAG: hypothetical protein KAX65_07595 [Caldilineaceae bacterium]|nr:hypothetical protein [Caldilineaceae bacterium]
MRGLEDLPAFTAEADPLNLAIGQLDREIQQLHAQCEAELSRRDPATLNRDLARKSRNTLKNKTAELQLASTAPTSEVRFAAPRRAVPPLRPEERLSLVVATALGALVGLLAGVFVAFASDYMGKAPPLRRAA